MPVKIEQLGAGRCLKDSVNAGKRSGARHDEIADDQVWGRFRHSPSRRKIICHLYRAIGPSHEDGAGKCVAYERMVIAYQAALHEACSAT